MPNNSCPARALREGCFRATIAVRFARALAFTASLGVHALGAQRPSEPIALSDPWTVDAQYLQLNSGSLARHATPSLAMALSRSIGRPTASGMLAWRAEAGWLRATRQSTTAQGATIGISADLGLPGATSTPSRLILRPGITLLAGWAEAQDSVALYPFRGSSPVDVGATGTQYSWFTNRGSTYGAGISLGAELGLSSAISLSGSIRHWSFSGDVIKPNRNVTLAGVGIAMHPQALAHDARRWFQSLKPNTPRDVSRDGDAQRDTGASEKREEIKSSR
jgi:hypothetical protein